jgi:hypothetical protein
VSSGRWHVIHEVGVGAFGWSEPTLRTDDPDAVEQEVARLRGLGYRPVAVLDDQRGEGEPLDVEQMFERLDDERSGS